MKRKRKNPLAKRKRRSYPRRLRAWRRRRKDKRLPLSVGVGLATSVLAPPASGWSTPLQALQSGQIDLALQSFVRSWTGFAMGGIGGQSENYFNLFDTLNPFSMEAPALKATIWTAVGTKIAKYFIKGDPFSRVPILNKFVKFA